MSPALKSLFATTINLNQNNLNFGETIYLKTRAMRQEKNHELMVERRLTDRES